MPLTGCLHCGLARLALVGREDGTRPLGRDRRDGVPGGGGHHLFRSERGSTAVTSPAHPIVHPKTHCVPGKALPTDRFRLHAGKRIFVPCQAEQ
jgi:hypothetical protein